MHRSTITLHSSENLPESLCDLLNGDSQQQYENLVQEPSKKRRKANKTTAINLHEHIPEEDFLCLARVDLSLAFDSRRGGLPQFSSNSPEHIPVTLTKAENLAGHNDKFTLQFKSLAGVIIIDTIASGKVSLETSKALKHVATLSSISWKKTSARSFCTVTLDREPSSNGGIYCNFCLKLLLPNHGELMEGLALDRRLLVDLCGIELPASTGQPWSPRDFYDSVHVPEKNMAISDFPQIEELRPQLYPFQKRAVKWLLHREGIGPDQEPIEPEEPHSFTRTIDAEGRACMANLFLGILTTRKNLVRGQMTEIKGGILSEEMGLGKTVEMIGLICLHRQQASIRDEHASSVSSLNCSATLIITPPSILDQWRNELQTLAPGLQVTTYEGLHAVDDKEGSENYASKFENYDVVLTTYNVLTREIHHSGHVPDRDLRHEKKYERKLSPLTQLTWWRVILDEAQMIESGVSNAAKVAQLIPRQHAWCVSGTPVRKSSQDLRGLLVFLRCRPYCYSVPLWDRLIRERRDLFKQLFGKLALRHTKEQIREEVCLPSQRRVLITLPFNHIEEQHYSTLYNQMCEECGVNGDGAPLLETWDPDDSTTIEKMRSWLTRLRQTCLHAEVGGRNRRALGKGKNPLRTVGEVLEVMVEQNSTALRAEERALLMSRARKGQILEHAKRSKEALNIWLEGLSEARLIVAEARSRFEQEAGTLSLITEGTEKADGGLDTSTSQTGAHRQRLRAALEVEHILTFFTANAYFQIKSDEKETHPETEAFQQLEKFEETHYEIAKLIRKELLVESRNKADSFMKTLNEKSLKQSFINIPKSTFVTDSGGIESRNILSKLKDVVAIIYQQANQIDEWRAKTVKLLTVTLVDEEDTELQGDEYENSTQQQDTIYSYVDALRAIVSDFHDVVTGQTNARIEHEMRGLFRQALEGEGHSSELLKELLSIRQGLKAPATLGSVRGIVSELRELRNTLRWQLERGVTRAGAELGIVNISLKSVESISVSLSKAATALEHEVELFTNTMNSRLEYYRQLQQISDTVAPYEDDMDDEGLAAALAKSEEVEAKLRGRLSVLKSTARYLDHLRAEASNADQARFCIICQQTFELGVLTSCGHSYCAECLRLWRKHHGNCPTCKKRLDQNDLHPITYKPQELTVQEEGQLKDGVTTAGDENRDLGIYCDIGPSTLNEIKNVDIDVERSFGTKIDAIARHVLWLREKDPGSKSIIFSQFGDFLSVLGTAFNSFRIGYTSIDKKNGVQRFKNDPGIECFLMHAKGNSSGLTLVNATHVFLCEPLINTAIELQAIARVHRIGQRQATTVWVYVVEDTVEKSIYDISVERRMAHIGKANPSEASQANSGDLIENMIEAANTLELEEAPLGKLLTSRNGGGEVVQQGDLWKCLFGQKPAQTRPVSARVEREVGRHLRASAAEDRLHEVSQ